MEISEKDRVKILRDKIIQGEKNTLAKETGGMLKSLNESVLERMPLNVFVSVFLDEFMGAPSRETIDKFVNVSTSRFLGVSIIDDEGKVILDTPPLFSPMSDESLEVIKKYKFVEAGLDTLNDTLNKNYNPTKYVDRMARDAGNDISKSVDIAKAENNKRWKLTLLYINKYINREVDVENVKSADTDESDKFSDDLEFEF